MFGRRLSARTVRVTLIAGIGLGLSFAVFALPLYLAEYDLQGRSATPAEQMQAVHNARSAVLQVVVGVTLALGTFATWRRLSLSEDELRATRDGQVTERFTRAVEQLGNANVDVRIGGIYALERIARNSPVDNDAIISILSAFVRGHSPWPPSDAAQPPAEADPLDIPTLASRANDVQSAVVALGRMSKSTTSERIRIPATDMRRARLWGMNFDNALFGGSNLRDARLAGASLVAADLGDTDLRDADLRNTDLRKAWLRGADLRGAKLDGAQLEGAESDSATQWSRGFDALARGVIVTTRDRHYGPSPN